MTNESGTTRECGRADRSAALARADIRGMQGYAPGEQPRDGTVVKLNTNENPYPPSPHVLAAWSKAVGQGLRLYPDPVALELRTTAAALFGLRPEQVIAGNGSDDLLTIGVRTFVDQGDDLAYVEPSYSLYPILARIQGANPRPLRLEPDFQLPRELPGDLARSKLLFVARPNAPTGTSFPLSRMERLCREFRGVVWIDEAYADFADDHCLDLVGRFDNLVVSRTLSKSYSLAGLRVGLAFAQCGLVAQMLKVKDSYNLSWPAQHLATAALRDQAGMLRNAQRIRATRERVVAALEQSGFRTLPSQTNFIFTEPPLPARVYLGELRKRQILVRYFPGERTDKFVRITIGTEDEMERLLAATAEILAN